MKNKKDLTKYKLSFDKERKKELKWNKKYMIHYVDNKTEEDLILSTIP